MERPPSFRNIWGVSLHVSQHLRARKRLFLTGSSVCLAGGQVRATCPRGPLVRARYAHAHVTCLPPHASLARVWAAAARTRAAARRRTARGLVARVAAAALAILLEEGGTDRQGHDQNDDSQYYPTREVHAVSLTVDRPAAGASSRGTGRNRPTKMAAISTKATTVPMPN